MTQRLIPVKQTQEEITTTVREMLEDGAMLDQVMTVLRDYLIRTKSISLIKNNRDAQWLVVGDVRSGRINKLFSHVSLAVCVEFMLKYEVPHD